MEKKKVILSLIYKFIERLSVKGLGLIISIILARLLEPEAFGQIAIMTVFINLSQVIVESGFTTALIQRKDVEERDYSTVFFINLGMAVVCFLALQIIAPWVSDYYNQDITKPLRVYAGVVFLGAFNALQLAKMQKQMQFRKMMLCSLSATIVSGLAGVLAAYFGLGIWALIIYNMMNSFILCIAVAFAERWLPKFEFSLSRAKILFNYGWKMFVSAVLCSLYSDIRSLIIGKKYASADLAYYNRGQQFPQVISHTLDSAIQSVMFPVMSTVQDETSSMGIMLKNSVSLGTYIIAPIMFGLAAVSEPVVLLLLTEKWLPCVPYMKWLCIGNAAVPIISSNLITIKSSGRSDIYMKLEIFRRSVMLVVLIASVLLSQSVEAIAIGFCISSWLDALIVMVPASQIAGYSIAQQFSDIWKTILSSGIMMFVVSTMSYFGGNRGIILVVQIIVGVVVYLGLSAVFRIEAYRKIIGMAKEFSSKRH